MPAAPPAIRLDTYFCDGPNTQKPCEVCRNIGPVRCTKCQRSIGCHFRTLLPLFCPACSRVEFGEQHMQAAWGRFEELRDFLLGVKHEHHGQQ